MNFMLKILDRHPLFITSIRRKRKLIKKAVKKSAVIQDQAKAELEQAFTIIAYDSADESATEEEVI